MIRYIAWASLTALMTVAAGVSAASELKPETMARNCYTCHGTGGHPENGLTPLVGIGAEAIEASLVDFKTDKRPATIMNRIAKGFTEAEIKALAAYLATLK